jgi:hypothetical protein
MGSPGFDACRIARPRGRAQPTASIQVARLRSRAPSPGRRSARSASRIATRSRSPLPRSRTSSGPPTRISSRAGNRAGSFSRSRRTGTGAARPAHSSTSSAPPRLSPKDVPPQDRQRPGAPQTTQATAPAAARSIPPQEEQAAGSPHVLQTCATPYPGSGEKTKPRRVVASALTSLGARPPGPGLTTSTGGQRRTAGSTAGSPSAEASADGHAAARTHTARSRRDRARATSRPW